MSAPSQIERLDALAALNGWDAHPLDVDDVEGCTETFGRGYSYEFDDGFALGLVVAFGRNADSGRWGALRFGERNDVVSVVVLSDGHPVTGRAYRAMRDAEWAIHSADRLRETWTEAGVWPDRASAREARMAGRINDVLSRFT